MLTALKKFKDAEAGSLFHFPSFHVCIQEMPGDADYMNLARLIIPLELNYCQCMLELHEYYEVIEHASELLDKHKGGWRTVIPCLPGVCQAF